MDQSQKNNESERLLEQVGDQEMNQESAARIQNDSNEDNKEDSEEELSFIKQLISSSFSHGLPNCCLSGDYHITMTMIKNFFIMGGNSDLGAASAFFTAYYSLLVHITNLALNDTQGILGSKDIGLDQMVDQYSQGNRCRKPFLRFKQAVITGLIIFSFFCIIPSFFYSLFLMKILDVDEELAVLIQDMVIWALPAMAIRIINDALKTFLQNYKHAKILGYSYMVLIGVFFLYQP